MHTAGDPFLLYGFRLAPGPLVLPAVLLPVSTAGTLGVAAAVSSTDIGFPSGPSNTLGPLTLSASFCLRPIV